MSDEPIGEGWWQASDGKWYPPETHPDRQRESEPAASTGAAGSAPTGGGPFAAPDAEHQPGFGGTPQPLFQPGSSGATSAGATGRRSLFEPAGSTTPPASTNGQDVGSNGAHEATGATEPEPAAEAPAPSDAPGPTFGGPSPTFGAPEPSFGMPPQPGFAPPPTFSEPPVFGEPPAGESVQPEATQAYDLTQPYDPVTAAYDPATAGYDPTQQVPSYDPAPPAPSYDPTPPPSPMFGAPAEPAATFDAGSTASDDRDATVPRIEQEEMWGTFSVLPDPQPGERPEVVNPDDVPTPPTRPDITTDEIAAGSVLFGSPTDAAPVGGAAPVIGGPGYVPPVGPAPVPPAPKSKSRGKDKAPKAKAPKQKAQKEPKAKRPSHAKATARTAAPPTGPSVTGEPAEDADSRRNLMILGIAAGVLLVAVAGWFLFLRGGDEGEIAGGPTSVASETTVAASETTTADEQATGDTTAPGDTTAETTPTTAPDPNDPDGACKAALLSEDIAAPFQICDAYQFRRLQPTIAPQREDLDTACRRETYGDACIFIPTTLPPPPFQTAVSNGNGNGNVSLPTVASGAVIEVRNDGPGPITVATPNGVLTERPPGSVSRHYLGDLAATKALNVSASGPWTITVLPLTQLRDATLRAVGHGPDVLFLDNPTQKTVRFTHDGTGPFRVIGHPLQGVDPAGAVAVDTAGPADTSVVVKGHIIEIHATGNWTIIPE